MNAAAEGDSASNNKFLFWGCFIALVVKQRSRVSETVIEPEPTTGVEEPISPTRSIFEDENVMGIVSAATPVLLPALLRTATKNWPLVLAAAAGLYVFSRSETASAATQPRSSQV